MKILFLIYNSSWWGCFDGLYQNLSKNPQNRCDVLPLLVYRKDENGLPQENTGAFTDLSKLPAYVICEEYENFDISAQEYDIIFMHDPYDDSNSSSTVNPFFYSENLKQFTKQLIYIPHYMYVDFVPEHLKYCPVYNHVDFIYISTESVSTLFPPMYESKLCFCELAMDSYLYKLSQSRDLILKEWKKLHGIEKKKENERILFYHTGFDELLNGNFLVLEKTKKMFEYLNKKSEICLVWHIEKAVEERLEELPRDVADAYLKLITWFLDESIGIYEINENLYELAVICDGYMGEKHPVMNYFAILEKTVILLGRKNNYIPTDDEKRAFSIRDFFKIDNSIWFIPNEFQCLCKTDLLTEITEVVKEFPMDGDGCLLPYCGIEKIGDDIYFVPFNENGMMCYNPVEDKFEKRFLNTSYDENFDACVVYKNKLFLLPRRHPAIAVYDVHNSTFKYIDGWLSQLNEHVKAEDVEEPYFLWAYCTVGNTLYLAAANANIMLRVNMDSYEFDIFEVGPVGSKFYAMTKVGESFYLFPYKGKNIICYNNINDDWKGWENDLVPELSGSTPVRKAFARENELVIFGAEKNDIFIVGSDGKKRKTISIETTTHEYFSRWCINFMNIKATSESEIIANVVTDCSLYILANIEDASKNKSFPCRLSGEDYRKLAVQSMECKLTKRSDKFLTENDDINQVLEYFLRGSY